MRDRHERVIAAFEKAKTECPSEEVFDAVLAAIPGLTDQDLNDHLLIDWFNRECTATRH